MTAEAGVTTGATLESEGGGWPQTGDRVYADGPDSRGVWHRGLGTVRCVVATEPRRQVAFDGEGGVDHCPFGMHTAACHRKGPRNAPPGEGAVFLGQFPFHGSMMDVLWRDGQVRRREGSDASLHGYRPCDIDCPGFSKGWADGVTWQHYRTALACARELGLVE